MDYSNNNLNNNNNFINYTPIVQDKLGINNQNYKYNSEKQSNSVGNNFNITRQNKNIHRNNNNSLTNNKPLNNFNPNLIMRRGTPQGDLSSFIKRNEKDAPIKIKNNNRLDISNKKPTTPILNHYDNNDFIDNNNHNKFKYNINIAKNNKSKEIKNNTMSNRFGYSITNNNKRKIGVQRPSTAPHKDKGNQKNNKNTDQKINPGNLKQSKLNNNFDRNIKFNKRPCSAGGKNKNEYSNKYNNEMNRNINKTNANNNIKKNTGITFNKRLPSPQIYSSSNAMGFNNNNEKIKNNQSKHRIPSPMIKSKNYKRPPLPNRGPKIVNIKK
jgi:hypothetical protein